MLNTEVILKHLSSRPNSQDPLSTLHGFTIIMNQLQVMKYVSTNKRMNKQMDGGCGSDDDDDDDNNNNNNNNKSIFTTLVTSFQKLVKFLLLNNSSYTINEFLQVT